MKEGSSVYVKILSHISKNTYVASFAGSRFTVHSNLPLLVGENFRATISFQKGKIILMPKDGMQKTENIIQTFSNKVLPDGTLTDANLSAFFSSLGLSPDFITLYLFEQMQSLNMPFDYKFFMKAYNLAKKFSKNEKSASELSMLLKQKGIELTEDAIKEILHISENENESRDNSDARNKNDNSSRFSEELKNAEDIEEIENVEDLKNIEDLENIVRNFFCNVFDCEENKKYGLLSLFNHTGFSKQGSWIQIPFTFFDFGEGVFRYFVSEQKNNLKKMFLSFSFDEKKYFFALKTSSSFCNVKYAILPNSGEDKKLASELETFLKSALNVPVESLFVEEKEISGFFADSNFIKTVEALA
ncbi:MAG: hypothetical protein IKI31_02735 [Treponema sp.]|nr:hypothetical protein [Treponema sp.]